MKKGIKKQYVAMVFSVLILLCFTGVSLAADVPAVTPIVKKADLIVEKIEFKKLAQDPAIVRPGVPTKVKYKVEIKVTVKNKAIGDNAASAGAFKVLLEWSDNPPAGFNYLAEGGVAALAPGTSKALTFEQWVPKGTARKYKATADNLKSVVEWDETNNVNSAGYVAE